MAATDPPDKSKQRLAEASAAPTASSSKLFKLPTDLRVSIYELCLPCEDTDPDLEHEYRPMNFSGVLVNCGSVFPSLLHVSRQIRAEATPVWFKINEFAMHIENLDAQSLKEWVDFCESLARPPRKPAYGSPFHPKLQIWSNNRNFSQGYNWANLMQWSKWVHKGELEAPPGEAMFFEGERLAAGALLIAKNHRGRSWEECESSLSGLKVALGWSMQFV